MRKLRLVLTWLLLLGLSQASLAQATPRLIIGSLPEERVVQSATKVLQDALTTPDRGIPRAMLSGAQGVVIVPRLIKIGLIAGVRHGRGVLVARDAQGNWQAPQFITITGGSIGWQVGIASSDLVLVFRNRDRVDQLLRGRFTIGVDAAAAAGPVGRRVEASTDARLNAEIYSYARSRGLFVGVSIDGAVLQIDQQANQAYYASGTVPTSALTLIRLLQFAANAESAPAANAASTPGQLLPTQPATSSQVTTTLLPRSDVDSLKRAFLANYHQMAKLLDQAWQQYLAPPPATGGSQPSDDLAALQALLAKYDRVASDNRYAALTQRREFQATRQALQQLIQALQAQAGAGKLALPPPPGN